MIENITFTLEALQDYQYWQTQDKRTLKKVNKLIADIIRNGNENLQLQRALWRQVNFFITFSLQNIFSLYNSPEKSDILLQVYNACALHMKRKTSCG